MSEFNPVSTKQDLDQLDSNDIYQGYLAGLRGDSEPSSAFSRSYWHGWRNGMVDSKRAEIDHHQRKLAREIVGKYRGLH